MTRLFHFIERRPLTVSIAAWLASLPTIGLIFAHRDSFHFDASAFAMCIFSLVLSGIALANLIRADRHGYSSTKIGLSVTALFFAFVPPILLGMKLLRYIGAE
jgi:hypothetical protein